MRIPIPPIPARARGCAVGPGRRRANRPATAAPVRLALASPTLTMPTLERPPILVLALLTTPGRAPHRARPRHAALALALDLAGARSPRLAAARA
jgi:hypothetical protein